MRKFKFYRLLLLIGFTAFITFDAQSSAKAEQCSAKPTTLRCEYLNNPIGINDAKPRLSWTLSSELRDQMQSAYHIIVSEKESFEPKSSLVWDSGKVNSDQSLNVLYDGNRLISGQKYYWKVRIWDHNGNQSNYSETASFSMGLMDDSDWGNAQWIGQLKEADYMQMLQNRIDAEDAKVGDDIEPYYRQNNIWDLYSLEPKVDPAPVLRKAFQIGDAGDIESAMLYICGLGYYELHLNGQKLNNGINPARSDYDKSLYYMTYDVEKYLQDGKNAVGVLLGNGWYNMITRGTFSESEASWRGQPKMLMKLEIKYADGTVSTVVSDESWKADKSAVLWTDVRAGEVYDARLEQDWEDSDFDDINWKNTQSVPAPKGELVSQIMPPVRITRTFKPESMKETSPGIFVYDMGQNFSGWVRLKVKGPAGTKITVSMAEQPTRGDEFVPGEMERRQQYVYILKGDGKEEVFEPHFTYYGFEYVQIKGFPGTPTLDTLEACSVHTDLDQTGRFTCSDKLLNQLQQNVWWTCQNLVHSYPQDCPHREKNGWGDFNTLAGKTLVWNFDSALFFEKWMRDCKDQFHKNGAVGNIIPVAGHQGHGDPAWAAAWAVCAWNNYLYYGDEKVLADNYEEWKKWVKDIKQRQTKGDDEIIMGGIGDWVAPVSYGPYYPAGPEGPSIVTTSYYYKMVSTVAKAAKILGYSKDAREYGRWADSIRQKFNKAFYNESKKYYETEIKVGFRQASQVVPIGMGLVPKERYDAISQYLVDDIFVRHDGHLAAGTIGTSHLISVLPFLDLHDAAYSVVTQKTYPGWLNHIINDDATTIWENWNEGGSHNHSCFLSVGAYFYESLAGIRTDPANPGFKNIIIRPGLPKELNSADANYKSFYGDIESSWQRKNGKVYMNVTIPANTTADLSVPKDGMGQVEITESGKTVWDGRYFKSVTGLLTAVDEKEYVTFKAGSGKYEFVVSSVSDSIAMGRSADIDISCEPKVVKMEPGETASFVVRVKNNENSSLYNPVVSLDIDDDCSLKCLSNKTADISASGYADYRYSISVPESIGTCKVLFLSGYLKGSLAGKSLDVPFNVQVNVLKRILVDSKESLQIPSDYTQPVDMVEVENLTDDPQTFTLECQLPKGCKSLQKLTYHAEVSSMLDYNNRPERLYDNVINHSEMNRWHSEASTYPPHVIDIYLDKTEEVKRVVLHASSFVVYCKKIRLEYKDQSGQWKTIMEGDLPKEWVNVIDADVVTNQMKLTILSSVDNIHPSDPHFAQFNEIEILGNETQNKVVINRVIESGRKEPISLYLSPERTLDVIQKAQMKISVSDKDVWQGQVNLDVSNNQ